MTQLTLEQALADFLTSLSGKNRSAATIRAYQTDIHQFICFLHENNMVVLSPTQVERLDITDYLSHLAERKLSGVSRARKVAALREYFRYLVDHNEVQSSPMNGIDTPKREKHDRTALARDEYTAMLSYAGANVRDYAILQVFLQTGLRVSELVDLRIDDVDLVNHVLRVRAGKGMTVRTIELERKVTRAIKNYLNTRPAAVAEQLFLNYTKEPISERGVRKMVAKYLKQAGIKKKASCHSLRHTFATAKAQQGISAYRLRDWLGHSSLETTQIYIHLSKQNAQREMEQESTKKSGVPHHDRCYHDSQGLSESSSEMISPSATSFATQRCFPPLVGALAGFGSGTLRCCGSGLSSERVYL
jgi:integrase/recombinase XerC